MSLEIVHALRHNVGLQDERGVHRKCEDGSHDGGGDAERVCSRRKCGVVAGEGRVDFDPFADEEEGEG